MVRRCPLKVRRLAQQSETVLKFAFTVAANLPSIVHCFCSTLVSRFHRAFVRYYRPDFVIISWYTIFGCSSCSDMNVIPTKKMKAIIRRGKDNEVGGERCKPPAPRLCIKFVSWSWDVCIVSFIFGSCIDVSNYLISSATQGMLMLTKYIRVAAWLFIVFSSSKTSSQTTFQTVWNKA